MSAGRMWSNRKQIIDLGAFKPQEVVTAGAWLLQRGDQGRLLGRGDISAEIRMTRLFKKQKGLGGWGTVSQG